jgi:hypothetical protein
MLDGTWLRHDPHGRRGEGIEPGAFRVPEHVDNGQPGGFEKAANLLYPIQTLAPLVLAGPATSAHAQSLRQPGRIKRQRVHDFDNGAVPFLSLDLPEVVEHECAIHDFHCQAACRRHNPRGLPEDRFVFLFVIEEPEGIQQDSGVRACGPKWQVPHVSAHPRGSSAQFRLKLARPVQQRDGEVEADDLGPQLGEREPVSAMTAANVNDASGVREMKEIPERCGVSPHLL